MASAPLNWLLKIGGETLKTTAKTLSEAVNTLHDSVTSLHYSVTSLSTTKADADTTTEALDSLETNKLNISDLLSLEEIEASTSLTGKGATAESVKQINDSLGGVKFGITADGEYGYHKEVDGADTVVPFSSGIKGVELILDYPGYGQTNYTTTNKNYQMVVFVILPSTYTNTSGWLDRCSCSSGSNGGKTFIPFENQGFSGNNTYMAFKKYFDVKKGANINNFMCKVYGIY